MPTCMPTVPGTSCRFVSEAGMTRIADDGLRFLHLLHGPLFVHELFLLLSAEDTLMQNPGSL